MVVWLELLVMQWLTSDSISETFQCSPKHLEGIRLAVALIWNANCIHVPSYYNEREVFRSRPN